MESALYDSRGGYYHGRKIGEDFYTAPELHSAFGTVLAGELIRRLDLLKQSGVMPPYMLVEMGSGSGRLARDILTAIRSDYAGYLSRIQYVLVERAEGVLLESLIGLSSFGVRVLGYSDLQELPPCSGIFFSNELLDSFPLHLLEKRDGHMREVYVRSSEFELGELSSPELVPSAERLASSLEEGEKASINLEALKWLRLVSRKLKAGTVMSIDYGRRLSHAIPASLKRFRKHWLDDDPLREPGESDLTAGVDFESLIQEGNRLGLKFESYESLGKFLMDRKIMDLLPRGSDLLKFQERNKIKTLFHPEGMGDIYKVLIQRKGC
ncbi:MAG: SAM-dependent methyltransferase [Elusimicrobia bacterium]|nr:SAM-dependent methyltransferase [Elusimicrobiota bacterium]